MIQSESGSSKVPLLLAALLFMGGLAMVAFTYLRPPGTRLSGVDPARARPGDSVILRGSGFAREAAENTVIIGDRTARVVSASESQLTVEVPEVALDTGQPSSVAVRVVVGQRASAAVSVQVYRDAAVQADSADQADTAVQASPTPTLPVETAVAKVAAESSDAPAGGVAAPKPPRTRTPSRPTSQPVVAAAAPPPVAPAPAAPPALPPAQRRFVLERTNVESTKRVTAELEGFDTAGVDVKRAPDVVGRVDFEVTPPQVRPGDHFTVNVYLINDGHKGIKLKDMFVATSVNGRLVSGPSEPRAREVGPRKKAVIGSFSDTWRDTIATWAMDVTITSDRGDIYKNQVIWK